MSFSIRYSVPMMGPSCASSVSTKLQSLPGVDSVSVDLSSQEVVVDGSTAPSAIVDSMQAIGRDAFVRGSGRPNSAAVAILETSEGKVRGLARMIEVAHDTTLFDVSLDPQGNPPNSQLIASVFTFGNLSAPPQSLGPKQFDILTLPSTGGNTISGCAIAKHPLAGLIGRAVATSNGLAGVIARSAGLWENDKTVCTCSGKNVWEERKDFRDQTNGHL